MIIIIGLMLMYLICTSQFIYEKRKIYLSAKLSIMLLMHCGWFLYGVMPLFLVKNGDVDSNWVETYSITIFVCMLGWTIGVWFNNIISINRFSLKPSGASTKIFNSKKQTKIIAIANFMIFILLYTYVNLMFGGFIPYMMNQYGSFDETAVSSFTSVIPFAIAGIQIAVVSFKIDKLTIFSLIASLTIFLLGGNRNIAIFILLGVIYVKYGTLRIKYTHIMILLAVGIVAAALLAVMREYGVLNVITGSAENFDFRDALSFVGRYNEGEFGTMYRMGQYLWETGDTFKYHFSGFSYLISPVINLFPTFLYENRPNTIAVEFTYHYWGGKSSFIEGLGFSPIAEALVNYKYAPFVPFILMSITLSFISKFIETQWSIRKYRLIGACIASSTLNYFRIDFSLYVKFILLAMAFALITSYLITKLSGSKDKFHNTSLS